MRKAKILTEESVLQMEPSSDSSLSSSVLDRARAGDQQAFERLVSLCAGLVYYWCRNAGLGPEDAEDVGQQVFFTVSRSLSRFRHDHAGASFRGWLRTITKSRLADHFRELPPSGERLWDDRTITYQPNDNEESIETEWLYQQAVICVRNEFSEQDYQAFELVVMQGLLPREAAAQLEMSVNSVYIAKSRILKRLRDKFGDLLGDDT